MSITDTKIKKTAQAICNAFASDMMYLSDDMALHEQASVITSGFKDANSKLHGILLLVDDKANAELCDFVEMYIGRLKNVYDSLIRLAKPAEKTINQNDPLGR
ncbi:MAG: hypothetical protein ACXW1U_14495 [Methylobacter sp.]